MLTLSSPRLRVLALLLGGALFAIPAACGESSSDDDAGVSAGGDDESDDDATDDDRADDDGPGSTTTIETPDGGVVEVVFSGEGVPCGEERCRDVTVTTFPFARVAVRTKRSRHVAWTCRFSVR